LKCAAHYAAFRVSVALDFRFFCEPMTRRRVATALTVPVLFFAPLFAQTTTSVWTGVYTTAQATRGADLYTRVCSECHGDDLEGRERSPALAGASFGERWDGATLKKLFERMQEMPPGDPAKRLQANQYVDVLAFLLSANDVPAGSQPLVSDKDTLATIIYSTRPKF
jgi:mono/diheme cytochrome c family protein